MGTEKDREESARPSRRLLSQQRRVDVCGGGSLSEEAEKRLEAEDFPRTAGANLNNSRSAVLWNWKVEARLHHMIRFCVCA